MILNINTDDSSPMSTPDTESFTGKIVCSIDGSSFIIDAENATLTSFNNSSISVAATKSPTSVKSSVNSATNDEEEDDDQQQAAANPKIHTFRVVSANDATSIQLQQKNKILGIQKPILMCFICKLSFGINKSFSLHANTEHGVDLQDLEKHLLLQREYSSAIIQKNMNENPQISFLEPVDIEASPLSAASSAKDSSSCKTVVERLESDALKGVRDEHSMQTPPHSLQNATVPISITSTSSSSTHSITSCSLSLGTSSTTNAPSNKAPAVMSPPVAGDQQVVASTPTTSTTTLSSLNLNKSKNNSNTSKTSTDHSVTLTAAISADQINTTISATTFPATTTLPSTTDMSTTATTTSSSASSSSTSPLSSYPKTNIDLSASTESLALDTISTDSLVNINKYKSNDNTNSNNNNNSNSIEPHPQHQKSSNQSPRSHNQSLQHHQLQQQQPISSNSIMVDFLQQNLHRIAAAAGDVDSRQNDDDSQQQQQHGHLEQDNVSWSHPTANTFAIPVTDSNASAAQISSLHATLAALNSEQNTSSVKLISEFLQHQLATAQQQHQQNQLIRSLSHTVAPNAAVMNKVCPDHTDFKGIDCKTCEMLESQHIYNQSPQASPQSSPTNAGIAAAAAAGLGLLTAVNQLNMSPNNSNLNANNNSSPLSISGSSASFTIGACSDHINGRPLGVECARCEMILNAARLNSNAQMSTRNSCKTLKCPQCNWHYKYQETLEIHMREKHPDGESACGYCLAGQQHPRLSRGETYSCGYKPYRCEICNYSTTTKGNLSIHMQSDKHLNNMQELNTSQNMVAAAVAVATGGVGKMETTPLISLNNPITSLAQQQQHHHHQQQQQQQQQSQNTLNHPTNNAASSSGHTGACESPASSLLDMSNVLQSGNGGNSNKPKPSFRCDICSYETSVARNLRIHMTSEKHTHNMTVLQNNIKHIQAITFLQHQHQRQQTQQHGGAGDSTNIMPEVALADLAYNQALMIQMLHQNAAAAQSQPAPGSSSLGKQPPLAIMDAIKRQVISPTTMTELPSTSPSPSPKSNDLSSTELQVTNKMEPPVMPDLWPTTLFSCLVCENFNTNSLDELNQHLLLDRSRQLASDASGSTSSTSGGGSNNSFPSLGFFSEIMVVQNNNYICCLCSYKTNLKANFQLHSKTDKHLQKLNFINHLREGGVRNEYKLKYYQQQQHQQQISGNIVQIKCNSCDFYTNSIQKLSLHTQHMRHENMIMIFKHLNYLVQQQQATGGSGGDINDDSSSNIASSKTAAPSSLVDSAPTTSDVEALSASAAAATSTVNCSSGTVGFNNKSLVCHLCNFNANSLLQMIQHVKSIRHLQVEQFVCLQRRSEQLETPSLDDVFTLCDKSLQNSQTAAQNQDASINVDNKAAAAAAMCFTSLIESGNDGPFAEHSDGNDHKNTNLDKIKISALSTNTLLAPQDSSTEAANDMPGIIYKCKHCDYFRQIKNEVITHINSMHPKADSEDVISISTNPLAIQAFQAAIAAVSRDSKSFYPPSSSSSPNSSWTTKVTDTNLAQEVHDDMLPVAIKRERLDLEDQETMPREEVVHAINSDSTAMDVDEQRDEVAPTQRHQQQQQLGCSVQCPLCQDYFTEKPTLELHLMTAHSVNRDGLARLLLLVDTSVWQQSEDSTPGMQALANEAAASDLQSASSKHSLTATVTSELLQCQQCSCRFKHEQQLLQHAQKMQHFTLQQGKYLCLAFNSPRNSCAMHFATTAAMFNHYNDTHMRLVISERHVYKYRCKQCSLAFKTQEKLSTHTLYHTMRDATKCAMCQRNFRSTAALQKHMEQAHNQAAPSTTTANNSACSSPRTVSPSGSETERHVTALAGRTTSSDKQDNKANTLVGSAQDLSLTQPPSSLTNELQTLPSAVAHQQQMAAIMALIKQQQQQQTPPASELFHHLQMQQQQQFQNLPVMHNLQQIQQQLPQLVSAAAASGIPLNPVEMLNIMQFHHLMSLNFMNLAPPLIYGGNATAEANPSSDGGGQNPSPNISNSSISTTTTSAAAPPPPPPQSSSTSAINITSADVTVLPKVDVNTQMLQHQQQQQISPAASSSQLSNNQKRARTRITDDQLKILRAHFDINNSPSEESILDMSQNANLPLKVVKHWFRNTLFKERQRNKDSPYNFNNPPSTTLNLEEYERTGQAKVMPLTEQIQQHQQLQIPSRPSSAHSISNVSEYSSQHQQQQLQLEHKQREEAEILRSQASSVSSSTFPLDVQIKSEIEHTSQQHKIPFYNFEQQDDDLTMISEKNLTSAAVAAQQQQQHAAAVAAAATFYSSYETKSEDDQSSDMHSRPQTPNNNTTSNLYASMNELLSQQLENMPHNQMGPPKKFQLNPSSNSCSSVAGTTTTATDRLANLSQPGSAVVSTGSTSGITVSSKLFEKHSPSAQYDNNSNSSNSSTTSSGKRANRTRFTDYQIKVLQEFFENNSYPKDSDLEYLSKLLLLSPRVIVVWFQNARQKQRKIYENQPNNSVYETEEKKQNINYACKKCNLVFQRYYELIRHQKNHCFKEENNKKSAKAQIAAAQIAQSLSSEDSNSSMDINSAAAAALLAQHYPVVGASAAGKNTSLTHDFCTIPISATSPPRDHLGGGNNNCGGGSSEQQKFDCDKCKMTFVHFEHLREHQLMHLVNPNLHMTGDTPATTAAAAAAYGPFGSILQSLQQAAAASMLNPQPSAKKRKYSETSSNADEVSSSGGISLTGADYDGPAKKYNFLYQYFVQNEGNSELRQQLDNADLSMEFLLNYHQQTELKRSNNYDFLFQYYTRNEQQTNANFELDDNNKPSIEYLLQYYQLCESKKFFQLKASPQRIHDETLTLCGIDVSAQHSNNTIINTTNSSNSGRSSRRTSNDSHSSHGNNSNINEESNGGGVRNDIENENSPQSKLYSGADEGTLYKVRQNGQESGRSPHNNNDDDKLENNRDKHNNNYSEEVTKDKLDFSITKLEDQIDQLDGPQEVNNHSDTNRATTSYPLHLQSDHSSNEKTYYQNLEDFLDATMIENHSHTLTFPSESDQVDISKSAPATTPPMTMTNPCSIQPPVTASSATTANQAESNHKQNNKRLRTTILPEQLNFLYECYQNESNPSRKMLEEIAKKVSLKKRVVQVWFQNSRAKDKKSRNQQRQNFPNISDDNSNSSSLTNVTSRTNANALATAFTTTITGNEPPNDITRDGQVNIHQHPFTMDHILKVKELLAQTTVAAAASDNTLLNNSGDENKKYPQNVHGELMRNGGEFPQQLALMMMTLQASQNIPVGNAPNFNSLTLGDNHDNNVSDCESVELKEKTLSASKCKMKKLTKTKRNPIKTKNYMMKYMTTTTPLTAEPLTAEQVANDNEIFLNLNANSL